MMTIHSNTFVLVLVVLLALTTTTSAFTITNTNNIASKKTIPSALHMVPKFVGNKWEASSPEEMPEAGYDVLGTFLRQGPEPTITRIFSPDDYEQAVLKFMATEKCDRKTAQGNMDAYLRNPPDWTYIRMQDQKKGYKRDYVTLSPIAVAKVLVWSTIVFGLAGRAIYAITTGNRFNL
jgi:hypothetical protein